jgi:uncharacterized metal-binding protein YceD (DUF177 family)
MELKIYVDRLKEGQEEIFEGTLPTSFLGTDPLFQETVFLSAKACVTGDLLILKLEAKTAAFLPCSICNEQVLVPLEITDVYHDKDLKEIPSVFDFSDLLREDLLLGLPQFTECRGNCPERQSIKNYLKQSQEQDTSSVQFPFSNL